MENQTNRTLNDMDKAIARFLKRYFNFFKLPEFVPRKWLKKYKALLRSIYELREQLEENIENKDAALENLNINDWVDTIESYILELRELLSELEEIDDENKKAVLEKFDAEVKLLEDDFKTILENQETYPWYTGDGTTPVCFIDLTGCYHSVIDVGIEGETPISYTGGRVYGILPNKYSFKISPNQGYLCERTVPPTVLNYSGSYSFDFNDTNFTFTLNLTEAYNGTTIYIAYNPNEESFSATIAANVTGATTFLNNMAIISTEISLPAAARITLVDYDGYTNGDTPTITGYTGGNTWYKSGDNWTFQDTLGREYDGKVLTVNYAAVPLIFHNVKLTDSNNGYNVYINGAQTFSADVESADDVEIVCYLIDGYESSGLPTIIQGIDSSQVTRKGLFDDETGEQTGWLITFKATDMTEDVIIELHSKAVAVPTDDYRIYWNGELKGVNIEFNTIKEE